MASWHRLCNWVLLGTLTLGSTVPELWAAINPPKPPQAAKPVAAAPKPAAPDAIPNPWKAGVYKNIALIGLKDRSLGVFVPLAFDKDPKAMLPLVWIISTGDTTDYNIDKWAEAHDTIVIYPHNGISGNGPLVVPILQAELNTINSLRYDRNKVYILGMDTAGPYALLAAMNASFRPPAGVVVVGAVGDAGVPRSTPLVLLPHDEDMDKSLSNLLDRAQHKQNPVWFRHVLDSAITRIDQMPTYLEWMMEATAAGGPASPAPVKEAAKTRLLKRIELAMKVNKVDTLDLEVHQLLGIPVIAALPEGKALSKYWFNLALDEANKMQDKVERYHRLVEISSDQITATQVDREARIPLDNALSELIKDKTVKDDADSGRLFQMAQFEETQARKETDKAKSVNRMRQAQKMYDSISRSFPDSLPGRSALICSERLKAEISMTSK